MLVFIYDISLDFLSIKKNITKQNIYKIYIKKQKDIIKELQMITKEKKLKIISEYRKHQDDTGSPEVQIALLDARIKSLNKHFKSYPKDHSSRRGLLIMVGQRRNLLKYLKQTDLSSYRKLIENLGIRK